MKIRRRHLKIPFFLFLFLALITFLFDLLTDVELPTRENPIVLYAKETRDDLKKVYKQAIGEAKESILLIVYSLNDATIIEALRTKAQEGVKIHVVCDAKATESIYLGPLVQFDRIEGKGIMHQKILVIDKEKVFIGSANMTPTSLCHYGNLVCGFYSPPLADYILKRQEALTPPCKKGSFPSFDTVIGMHKLHISFLPDDFEALSRIEKRIETAKKSIKVAMFTFTRLDLAEKIIMAKKRGIEASVVIDHNSSLGVSSKVVDRLARNAIDLRISQGEGLLHHKFMILDDSTLILGSANWTKAAFLQNEDCFFILEGLTSSEIEKLSFLWRVIQAESFDPLR